MDELLNRPIKEVIAQYPPVADILNTYNIGCVPCQVGSCLLKDIVSIHNLGESEERALFTQIIAVVYPGQKIVLPKLDRPAQKKGPLTYSPPMQTLVDEHVWIKRVLACIPSMLNTTDITTPEGKQWILDCVTFIRSYADKFHHAKEEDILFKFFDEKTDILQVMLTDHVTGRAHVAAAVSALEHHDAKGVAEHLEGYRALLTDHIRREDEVLYPWMDRNLSMKQVGQLQSLFQEAGKEMGTEVEKNAQAFVEKLEGTR